MLADAFNVGFIVFASREQGQRRWIQGLNLERGDYPYWMLLYWIDPVHYQLAALQSAGDARSRAFYATQHLPLQVVQHYNLCNGSSPIGRAHYGGIS